MTEYIAGLPVAGRTKYFVVTYGDEADVDALLRAKAVLATCEDDLAALNRWFGVDYGHPGVWVHLLSPGKHLGGAYNTGYNEDSAAQIVIEGTYAPAQASVSTGLLRAEVAQGLMIAELAEVLMGYAGGRWGPNRSDGEGLSVLAFSALRPTGYYGSRQGPRVNDWLTRNDRDTQDWVIKNDDSDKNWVSFGCATLFLNYLISQLGFSVEQVIAAKYSNKIFSLADLTQSLTGRPAELVFSDFTDLLNAHLPRPAESLLATDNPFPLRDAHSRSVSFGSVSTKKGVGVRDPKERHVTMKPGLRCEAQDVAYHDVRIVSEVVITASCVGFAQPVWTWTIGGAGIPPFAGAYSVLDVKTMITDSTPAGGESFEVTQRMRCQPTSQNFGRKCTIKLTNLSSPGNGTIDVKVSVNERQLPDSVTSSTRQVQVTTLRYDMPYGWAETVRNCNPAAMVAVGSMAERLYQLIHPEGPSPQELPNIRELAAAAAEYVRGLDQATGGVRGMDSVIEAMTRPPSTVRDNQRYTTTVPADETGEAIQIALQIDPPDTHGPDGAEPA